ncbi:MAG TPA: hypothetical protein VLH94_01045 [Spirochaetia bacterium]|nr:hypothetical protein [Spirochaetia bacterium]
MDQVDYENWKNLRSQFKYDVFLICPVREASWDQKFKMEAYIAGLESLGKKVYYPARDTNQVDDNGYRICEDNRRAIFYSREVHIFFDPGSKGSLFDLGIAFALDKSLTIVNLEDLEPTPGKSFTNMIMAWSKL